MNKVGFDGWEVGFEAGKFGLGGREVALGRATHNGG